MRLPPVATVSGLLALQALAGCARQGPPLDLSRLTLVDLTHPLSEETLYWPTSPTRFRLERLAYGPTPAGFFYAANAFSTPEHGGTHLDAPIHFHEGGATADRIELARLIAPAVVLDIADSAAVNPDYQLTVEDVLSFERRHGQIAPGTIVLLRTGWSSRWPDARAYLGDDTPGDASRLRFPSFGPEAARLLVEERRVAALGADVASIDVGRSTDFSVHRIAAAAGVPGFENLTNLEQLPAAGAVVVALPIKIRDGSGGPLRAVALIPR
jgi:kynurenine formamidase